MTVRCDAFGWMQERGCGRPAIQNEEARSLAEYGKGVTPPAASIPGSVRNRRSSRSKNSCCFNGKSAYFARGKARSRVMTCDGSNPGFVARKLLKLLISNPAPARSNIDKAT